MEMAEFVVHFWQAFTADIPQLDLSFLSYSQYLSYIVIQLRRLSISILIFTKLLNSFDAYTNVNKEKKSINRFFTCKIVIKAC